MSDTAAPDGEARSDVLHTLPTHPGGRPRRGRATQGSGGGRYRGSAPNERMRGGRGNTGVSRGGTGKYGYPGIGYPSNQDISDVGTAGRSSRQSDRNNPELIADNRAAAGTKPQAQPSDETEADLCFICASPVVHHSVSPCNHHTCHICALRLRALYKTKACAHCRVRFPHTLSNHDTYAHLIDPCRLCHIHR